MAKYDNTKFYWLQLKEDFFDEDAIDWLEDQPNGERYSLFYLKLCLKSLRTNGVLVRKVGNMLVPYDHKKLGELTKTDPDTVLVAMKLLTEIGLVQVLENGELYIAQVETMIGSQSKSAFKKQQQRLAKKHNLLIAGGQEGDNCPPEEEKEKEEEEEQEKIDKLDKPQGGASSSQDIDMFEFLSNPYINALCERNFLNESDSLDLYKYDAFFKEINEQYDYVLISKVVNYVIARMKDNNEIQDKFNYFKAAVLENLSIQERRENNDYSDHWLYQ